MNRLESLFENFLWESRWIVLSAVLTSLLAGFALFYISTVDAYYMVVHLFHYASPLLDTAARSELRGETVAHVVQIVDGYLLATVLLIFALGLYELFISKIDKAERAEATSKVLAIHSLDDLKARLGKVVLMILIVKFFEHAIRMSYGSPIDLLYFAGGIVLIGLALYLSHTGDHHSTNGSIAKGEHGSG